MIDPIKLSIHPDFPYYRRQVIDYDFCWYTSQKKIVLRCYLSWYKVIRIEFVNQQQVEILEPIIIPGIEPIFPKELTASNTLVHPGQMGRNLTEQELADFAAGTLNFVPKEEYDYFVNVVGVTQLILPNFLKGIILARDQMGRFNTK